MPASIDGINKTCSKCGLTKHVSDFKKDSSEKDGYNTNCKACSEGKTDGTGTITRQSFSHLLKQTVEANDYERLKMVVNTLVDKAEEGDMKAMQILIDRYEGSVKQQVEHSGEIKNGTEQLVATANDLLEKIKGKK